MEELAEASDGWGVWEGQDVLLEDTEHLEHAAMGGMGYGKSTFGARWYLTRNLINDLSPSSIVMAPDYKLVKNVNLEIYISELEALGLKESKHFSVNISDLILTHLWGVRHRSVFLSAEKPKKIMAWTASHVWGDEVARCPKESVMNLAGRLRCKKAKLLQALYTYCPEGDNYPNEKFSSDKFERTGQISRNDHALILHGSSFDNPELPEEFFLHLQEAFGWDPAYWSNYVLGIPVSLSRDKFYFSLDVRRNIKAITMEKESKRLFLTLDWNVGMMSWATLQKLHLPEFSKSVYPVHYANRSDAQNVEVVVEQFMEEYPPAQYGDWWIDVYGDARGHNMSDQTNRTGYQYLLTLMKAHYPRTTIRAHRSNPEVNERSLCTNRLLKQGRLLINPRCTKTIESAKMTESDGKGGIKKPSKDTKTHAMEAVDMCLVVLEPPPVLKGAAGMNRPS